MSSFKKIKSFCKINLSLKIIKKLNNGYHNIASLIKFCNLYDVITIKKIKKKKDSISFYGKFKKGINNKTNTITKTLDLLRKNNLLKNKNFKIRIKKNIPHGSGLGGGSSNAAYLLNYLNLNMKLKLGKKRLKKIARAIGSDVPIILEKKNSFFTGENNKILRINKKLNLNILVVYPNLSCSTELMYKKNKKTSFLRPKVNFYKTNKKKIIHILMNESNDLQNIAIKIYPTIGSTIRLIESQKGCYFSRITGSGSACIGVFSSMRYAIIAKRFMKRKYPKFWCAVSKTI